jgi:GAF domain-containing protein
MVPTIAPTLVPPSDALLTPRMEPLPARGSGFGAAKSLPETLLLLLSTATERASAEAAMVHQVLDDGAAAVCAHGPRMQDVLGRRTPLTDPAVMAAASGLSIVTEPSPGPAGQAILARLTELGAPVAFALMLPIRPGGRLFGTLELGRSTPFSPDEVADVGNLTTEVARLIDAARWA